MGFFSKLSGVFSPKKRSLPYRVGLALGGGGARGFIHLGALQALTERGVHPEIIAGTSAGSIVGAFIASQRDPIETHKILKEKSLLGYSKIHWPKEGFFSLEGLRRTIEREIEYQNIEELPMPLLVTATNLNLGTTDHFAQGKLADAVIASSSIPFVFKPVQINGHKYADGGILQNLPVAPLVSLCEHIIAINISPVEETDDLNSLVKVAARTFQLTVNAQTKASERMCSLFIEPSGIRNFDIFDLKKADQLFEMGYYHVTKMDDRLLEPFKD